MADIRKHISVLENLNKIDTQDASQYFTTCVDLIQNNLSPILATSVSHASSSELWKYTTYMYQILLDIKPAMDEDVAECKSQTVAEHNLQIFAEAMINCSKYGLQPYLHPAMGKNKCFSNLYTSSESSLSNEELQSRLKCGVLHFGELLTVKELTRHIGFDEILLVFLAAVFSDLENDAELLHCKLDQIFNICSAKYFKTLLILKSNQHLPASLQKMLHAELMKRLVSLNGFEILCRTLIPTINDSEPMWKKSSAVFHIVAAKSHKMAFYSKIVDGIFRFLRKCITSDKCEVYIETCVGSLNRIYSLGRQDICKKITSLLVGRLDLLCIPKETLAGNIILDNDQFVEIIFCNFFAFCSSVNVRLPSEILIPYLRVWLQMFSQIKLQHLHNMVSSLIEQCLHNRERDDLKSIINSLLLEVDYVNAKHLHPRLLIKFNNIPNEHSCVICKASETISYDLSESLIQILKSSNNNLLTYHIFIHLFEQLEDSLDTSSHSKSDLVDDSDELTQLMSREFKKRVTIIYSLSELISHKQLHSQLNENPSEVLSICMKIIRSQLTKQKKNPLHESHVTIIVLSVIKELLGKLRSTEKFHEFINLLKELKVKNDQTEIANHIDSLLIILDQSQSFTNSTVSRYGLAKKLCEESEPHLKVYGIMQFIKLIREEKDKETLTNKHAVLAISMICLREDDSYTFLNCIKLLVALVDVLESQVLEMLIAEYQSTGNTVDHRLKIGEVIVKVTEGLGPISYKYKAILINCFLRECTSEINEIRLSSLSNLGGICRILSYQIHHFFEELMIIIHSVIVNDTYKPARRSAVMVLTDIICGIENIIDFQEILLPVYTTLRNVMADETDQSIRIHAESGLQHLNTKIKELLVPKESQQKEIKIFGIKDEETKSKKNFRFMDLNVK